MYQIFFNGYPLYDPRDPDLLIREPDIHLAVGEAGEVNFTIDADHPYADKLTRIKGVLELKTDGLRIYKGRIRKDTQGFYLSREIATEGLLACLNDSIIPPFSFPDDFVEDADYQAAAESGNVVQFFLGWLLDQHNSQVGPDQQIQMGDVTVSDPNNYISRASGEYLTTMEVIRGKLWDMLGGYPLVDYSGDTTVLHYYSDLPLTNTQKVEYGENLLDLISELDGTDTYTAILPIGADGLTIADLPDGEISSGIIKKGLIIYSEVAEEDCGGRITRKVTWDDVTLASNLQTKAVAKLTGEGVKTTQTIEATAVDLGASEEDVARFVVGRHVQLLSSPHGFSATFPLMELEPNIFNPGNTKITMGTTRLTLTGSNVSQEAKVDEKIESAKNALKEYVSNRTTDLENKINGIEGLYFYIKYSAYADGRAMTDAPAADTAYMGTCSTNKETAPTDYTAYTWVLIKGTDGKDGTNGTPGEAGTDGKTQYLHIKYSDDGKTFTENNGETLGAWIGTLVDFTEADSNTFSDYTWKKFTEDVTVGGRNLLLGTRAFDIESGAGAIQDETYRDFTVRYAGISASATSPVEVARWIYITPDLGETYTFSFYAKGTGSFNCYFYGATGYVQVAKGTNSQGGSINYGDGNSIFTLSEDWQRYWVTWTLSSSGDTSIPKYVLIRLTTGADKEIYVCAPKLEQGSIPTDWTPAPEDGDHALADRTEEINRTMMEQYTSLTNTCEEIIMSALESYVETSNYSEFRQTVESQLKLLAGEMTVKFTETTSRIENVNGNLQKQLDTVTKHFTFNVDGLTIGQTDSPYQVVIDNDEISILAKGVVVQQFDAEGRAQIPELKIGRLLSLFGYEITEDENNNLNCECLED